MKREHCPRCQELISASARRCPECGYALKTNWRVLMVSSVVIFCFALILLAPFLAKFIDEERKPKPKTQIAEFAHAIHLLI